MGKGKKRPAPSGVERRGAPGGADKPNLLERLSSKKRFDVLGRKVKGEVRQLGKLRSAATERRKDTLLVEYRQLRKSNAFIDRRFGGEARPWMRAAPGPPPPAAAGAAAALPACPSHNHRTAHPLAPQRTTRA